MNVIKEKAKPNGKARFDARLSLSQKNLFEKAAKIKGFKSLSEFVIHTTQEAALVIIEKHDSVLASETDRDIFFQALLNPSKPSKTLIQATKSYLSQLSAK